VDPVIITVATTGSSTTREHTPHVPLAPAEIANEIYLAWQAGAAIAHVHVRDSAGQACMDLARFRQVVDLVRERCDIILNLSSSGLSGATDDERIRPLAELHPEMASFDAGSTNLGGRVFINHPAFLERLAGAMMAAQVKPEIEVFEPGFINNALVLVNKNLLRPPLHFQFVLGAPGAAPAPAKNLLHMVESLPAAATWSVLGVGKAQLPMAAIAIVLGGHVRVGMEDNVYLRRGVLAKSNAEFVNQVVELAGMLQRPVATVSEARRLLGLPARPAGPAAGPFPS
jgi:3-keto-5-aminohexanoate cleavage enzyme